MVQSAAVSHKHVQKELFKKGGVDVGVSFAQLVRKELSTKSVKVSAAASHNRVRKELPKSQCRRRRRPRATMCGRSFSTKSVKTSVASSHNRVWKELLNEGSVDVGGGLAQPCAEPVSQQSQCRRRRRPRTNMCGRSFSTKSVKMSVAASHNRVRKELLSKGSIDVGGGLAQPCAERVSQQSQ